MRLTMNSQCANSRLSGERSCGIRFIFSVLFLVGKGRESVEVVDELLSIEKNPRKPQYNMSSDAPLCLYDADFGGEFEWIYEAVTLDEMIASHESRKQRWRENAEIEAQDDSSEEEMTSQKRQRLEIDKPSHIDDKPFGTLDKPKSGENKDPHIIYGENNKEDDDTVRDIDGETTSMKADKDICDSKTSLKDNGEENLETSENGYDTDQFDREYLTTNTEVLSMTRSRSIQVQVDLKTDTSHQADNKRIQGDGGGGA
ncbi:PUS3-like protein [Mya arenaria]|uniref:PUS3-like protein n=1 Tax=Mya arenaria TaxID=6604 RepID=A0ABY7DJX2_MYAAR|nr:PUS3-like protein [Mya arenaria]